MTIALCLAFQGRASEVCRALECVPLHASSYWFC